MSMCDVQFLLEELQIKDDASSLCQAEMQIYGCFPHFAQLIVRVPPQTNVFCLSLLWTLKERGMVIDWHWDDDILRVCADTDMILSRTSVPDSTADSWFLRLIEAANHRDSFPSKDSDDLATDFSFLCSDLQLDCNTPELFLCTDLVQK